jgi:quinol monooxygenase YgiN
VIREVLVPTRAEASDERLFFIHSCWVDEAAFERHAGEPHTRRFIARVRR